MRHLRKLHVSSAQRVHACVAETSAFFFRADVPYGSALSLFRALAGAILPLCCSCNSRPTGLSCASHLGGKPPLFLLRPGRECKWCIFCETCGRKLFAIPISAVTDVPLFFSVFLHLSPTLNGITDPWSIVGMRPRYRGQNEREVDGGRHSIRSAGTMRSQNNICLLLLDYRTTRAVCVPGSDDEVISVTAESMKREGRH